MALNTKRDHDAVQLIAASPSLATEGWTLEGVGESHRLAYQVNAFVFVLDVTATASVAGDWLLVYIQTKLDGTNWTDVCRFATVLGDATTERRVIKHIAQVATAEFEGGTGLGAGAVRNHHGDEWRVRWQVDRGCSFLAAFTFTVTAIPM